MTEMDMLWRGTAENIITQTGTSRIMTSFNSGTHLYSHLFCLRL
jgi:hypothetical protein